MGGGWEQELLFEKTLLRRILELKPAGPRGNTLDTVTRLLAGHSGARLPTEASDLSCLQAPRPTRGPQPPAHWVAGALYPGVQ